MKLNTQWAAQFAVASELCKRRYQVSYTLGNVPSVDLMATSPETHTPFCVSVKGLHKLPNSWPVKPKPVRIGLYFILAFVPLNAVNRFFIMTQEEVYAELAAYNESHDRSSNYGFQGVTLTMARTHENEWGKLPPIAPTAENAHCTLVFPLPSNQARQWPIRRALMPLR